MEPEVTVLGKSHQVLEVLDTQADQTEIVSTGVTSDNPTTALAKEKRKRFAPGFVPRGRENYFLTLLTFLDSSNHFSTCLYVTASYQRAVLEDFGSTCEDGVTHLKVLMPEKCPEEPELSNLPSCEEIHQGLCEADYAYETRCPLDQDINNCGLPDGLYDVYQAETNPWCSQHGIECVTLMKLIWALAFASFWSTTTCIGAFHGRRYHGSWKMPRHFLCVGALMQVLLILGFWTGLTQKSSWSIAMMILICAQFAPLLWAVLLVMKLDCQFAAMDPQAQSLTEKERSRKTWCMAAAMLELPGYNMLFASKLEPHQADILIGDRKPLDVILRLVEDVPEVILGVTDAILFGASWFTILSISLSLSMVVVALLLGSFQYLNASAAIIAKDLASAKDHAALPQRRSEAKPRETE